MTDDSSRCLTPEQIAAFAAGSLDGDELMMVAEHMRICGDCRLILTEAARVEREEQEGEGTVAAVAEAEHRGRRTWPWWLAAAAAAVAGIAWLTAWRGSVHHSNEAIHRLVEAAPADGRYVEPRLTGGFGWAPMRPVRRSGTEPLEPPQMKLVGVAGEVLEDTAGDSSPESQHAAAIAHLLTGRSNEAVALLEQLANDRDDARIWSDLAAARYAAGVQTNQPTQFAEALAAADSALRHDPKLPEALFNRALIVERLGLRDRARAAWNEYLAVDIGGPWAAEARRRLAAITPRAEFREQFERGYERLLRDDGAARALVGGHPQEARLWGETQILGRWAEASLRGDSGASEGHLRLARTFGQELARSRGDRMLLEAVLAIDTATPDRRRLIANGHLDFRAAQKLFIAGRAVDAAPLFDKAAAAFERGRSPIALLAHYFSANTLYDRGSIGENRARIARLLAAAPPQYPAHRAQILWQLGLVSAAAGEWGAAIEAFEQSIHTFERLDERKYAATVRQMLAEVYDRIGDFRAGWSHRYLALQELGWTEDRRTQVAVQAAARAAALDSRWPVSLALANLVVDMPRGDATHLFRVETLLFRARVHGRLAQREPAATDLAAATALLSEVPDQTARERAQADRDAVAGFLASSPAEAAVLFTRAIDFHRVNGRRMFLPELHLERGRALAAMQNATAAAADFEAGIHEIEEQRLSLNPGQARWGMFASSSELFDEAVTLALARRDRVAAFGYSERARARELLDVIGDDSSSITTAVPTPVVLSHRNAVLIEYVALPATLVTFVVDGGDVRVVRTPVGRAALLHESECLIEAATAGDTAAFRRIAASLYERLMAPVADALRDGRTVVFVPDTTLSTIPFAALVDREGGYVVERNPVVVAPSAGVFAGLTARTRDSRDLRLLVISGAAGVEGDVRQLTAAQREADAVAAAYPDAALVISPRSSGREDFETRAAAADVIHFVGHTDIPDANGDGALVLASDRGTSGRYDVRSIASLRLPRTRAVVLAACATARGERRRGEAGVSVARAFLAAGASSVVATLWPIEDEPASEFFPRLHHHLAAGLSPAEAVRAVQVEWIRHRDASPALWAAVQVIGS